MLERKLDFEKNMASFISDLKEQERSSATIQKYAHDLYALLEFLQDRVMNKSILIDWKQELISRYAPASVSTKLAAVNGYLQF